MLGKPECTGARDGTCSDYGIAVEYDVLMFIESPLFSRLVYDYLDDDAYAELQTFLAVNPEAGRLVRGSGGVRKARWSRAGAGKSGGLRVRRTVSRATCSRP